MKNKLISFCVICLCLITQLSFAQTTTIDYTIASFGSSCNIFSSAVTYQNIQHQTSFGYPTYSSTEKAVVLPTKPISQYQTGATQYSISYNFQQGYTYRIRVYGRAIKPNGTNTNLPQFGIGWSNSNGGTNTSTTCGQAPSTQVANFDANYGHMAFTTGYSWSGYLINGVASQNYSHLLIAAMPFPTEYNIEQAITNVYIQKIEITAVPPAAVFNLTPTSVNIACGSSAPVNFNVSNVNNTPGVTGYTWNLGPTPNGWLYNGSPASATVSTTSNTIALTPAFGTTPHDVSATVQVGSNQQTTNTSSVTLQQPNLQIIGPSSFCTTSDAYSIDNLPTNATVHWYDFSATTLPNTPTATSTTLSLNPGLAGVINLYAEVNTGCGSPIGVWKEEIHAGSADAVSYVEFSSNGFGRTTLCSHPYDFDDYANTFAAYLEYPTTEPINLTYRIYEYPSNQLTYSNTIYNFQNGQTYSLPANLNPGQYTFEAKTTNSCGISPYIFNEQITYANCGSRRQAMQATVFPNPATNILKVIVDDAAINTKNKVSPSQVIFTLMDIISGRTIKSWKISGNQKQYSLDIAGVHSGNYTLIITKDTGKVIKQVRIL